MTHENDASFDDTLNRQAKLREASAMTGARGEDAQRRDAMEGGETESTPETPAGDLDVADIANARETARGSLAGRAGTPGERPHDADPGAPWDALPDAMRMTPSDPEGPGEGEPRGRT